MKYKLQEYLEKSKGGNRSFKFVLHGMNKKDKKRNGLNNK